MTQRLAGRSRLALFLDQVRRGWTRGAGGRPMRGGARPQLIESLEARQLLSSTWFVAPWGHDNAPGTIAQPFQTIQRAAAVAGQGDTVEIRAGTYRETVHPTHGNITFEAYPGETVVVSGADVVNNWTRLGGNIWQANMPWDLGEGNNQAFVDGQMVNEARWPNVGTDLSHPNVEAAPQITVNGYGVATITDPKLAGGWTGASIHFLPGEGWYAQTGTVTASGPGWLTFHYSPDAGYMVPRSGNTYYLYGKFQGLDSPGEWFRDNSGALYLWDPRSDNPNAHVVEVKHRPFAFDLSGDPNVTLEGIDIFAATVRTDSRSSGFVMDHAAVWYTSQFTWLTYGWNEPGDTGIELNGANSTLENSTIAYSAGDGVYVYGAGSHVTHNVIHDTDYGATDSAAIHVYGNGSTIDHNLVYNTARCGIISRSVGTNIVNNTVFDAMLQTADGGGIYSIYQNGGGGQIAYNKVYGIHEYLPSQHTSWFTACGILLDNDCSNFSIHDNQIWDTDAAVKLNETSRNERVYNNTLSGNVGSVIGADNGDWDGTVVNGNWLYGPTYETGWNASIYNNTFLGGTPNVRPDPVPAAIVPPAAQASGAAGGGSGGPNAGPTPAGSTSSGTTSTTSDPAGPRSATGELPAASFDSASGVQLQAGGVVSAIGGNSLLYAQLDFGATGVNRLMMDVALVSARAGLRIQLRLDSPTGKSIGSLQPHRTGKRQMTRQSVRVRKVTGVHNLYLVFLGSPKGQINFDSFTFNPIPAPKAKAKVTRGS